MNRSSIAKRIGTSAGLAALSCLWPADVLAGHKHRTVQFAPLYVQQAPMVPQFYSAPTTQVYSAPATTQMTTQVFSAPAPTQFYSAPTTTAYSAPATLYSASAVGTTNLVGNAPVAGAKISTIAREDIISELRQEAKDAGTDGTMRERRRTLRDSARAKYAEELDIDESELSEADLQDIDNVVNLVLHRQAGAVTQSGLGQAVPTTSYTTPSVPTYAPQQATIMVQPVVPVQLFVPVQPKHHWLHK